MLSAESPGPAENVACTALEFLRNLALESTMIPSMVRREVCQVSNADCVQCTHTVHWVV